MRKVLFRSHSGPCRFLSEKEEEELVVFLMHFAAIGYPQSRKDVMIIVQATLLQKGHHNTLSYSWENSFWKRHPDLSLTKAEVLSHPRYVCVISCVSCLRSSPQMMAKSVAIINSLIVTLQE